MLAALNCSKGFEFTVTYYCPKVDLCYMFNCLVKTAVEPILGCRLYLEISA